MNIHEQWLESFNRPRDRGISFFQEYYCYERLNRTVNPNDIRDVLCHQYPLLKNNKKLLQECINRCNGSYRSKGPIISELIYDKHIKFGKKEGLK